MQRRGNEGLWSRMTDLAAHLIPAGTSGARQRKGDRGGRAGQGPKVLSLALQGGGSHGAFTWGVLDRLLEDGRLSFSSISGASAGAINGAVLASNLLDGGPEQARDALAALWQEVNEANHLSSVGTGLLAWVPAIQGLKALGRLSSPYQFNPLDLNPMRRLLERHVDFDRLRRNRRIKVYASATNVHTGNPRIFRTRELSIDALLASACLPHLYQAVEIEGAHYWDGGISANPPILPLVRDRTADDILIVHIDTQVHRDVPMTASGISGRLERILTNAPLLREIQLIGEMTELVDSRSFLARKIGRLAVHHILPPEPMTRYDTGSKLKTDWGFLTELRDIGRATAEVWLEEHFARLGTGKAVDLEASLMAPPAAAAE